MPARKRVPYEHIETTQESLQVLASYRVRGVRNSQDVVNRGEKILQEKGALGRMGDEVWPFLEQLGFAALDTGKNELASICVDRLQDKFPDSPRVDALRGLLLELESKERARLFYEQKLLKDENNVLVRKRSIALHLHSGNTMSPTANSSSSSPGKDSANLSVQRGISLLVDHLDTVYNDPEGWSQLADAYEKLGMFPQMLACLADLILLQPTNTFHVLRHAETAYTMGDYAAAYREFCRALEMAGPMTEGGLGRRAAFGIKLCLRRMGSMEGTPSSSSTGKNKDTAGSTIMVADETLLPKRAKDIDALVTKELLETYAKAWDNPGDKVAGHEESKVIKSWLSKQAASTQVVR